MIDSKKNWDEAGAQVVLVDDEVHVWLARLDQPLEMVTRSRSILSSEEKSRADRFHFEKDRTAYTVARAALKSLLAKYLDLPATDICFEYSAHGKPFLASAANVAPALAAEVPIKAPRLQAAISTDSLSSHRRSTR